MNNIATVPAGPSVLITMADRYGMVPAAFEATLRATVVPADASKEQFAAFLLICKEYKLNPILKEIYAFPRRDGGIQPIVSVDGWFKLANEHPQMNGMEFDDLVVSGELVAITARIWRRDREHPITVTEYMEECARNTDTWRQWPRRMLRHKAAIQGIRYAFGYSAIVDPDEAERMGIDDAGVSSGIGAPHVSTMRTISPPPAPSSVPKVTPPASRPRKPKAVESGAPEAPPIGAPVTKEAAATAPGGNGAPDPGNAASDAATAAGEPLKDPPSTGWREDPEPPAEEATAAVGRTELDKPALDVLKAFGNLLASQNTSAAVMRQASRFYEDHSVGDDDVSPFAYAASQIVEAHRRRTMGDITIAEADALVRKATAR
jgi:phage recombination protein Bet